MLVSGGYCVCRLVDGRRVLVFFFRVYFLMLSLSECVFERDWYGIYSVGKFLLILVNVINFGIVVFLGYFFVISI